MDVEKITDEIINVYETVSGEVLWKQNQIALGMIVKLLSKIEPHLLPLIADYLVNNYTEK